MPTVVLKELKDGTRVFHNPQGNAIVRRPDGSESPVVNLSCVVDLELTTCVFDHRRRDGTVIGEVEFTFVRGHCKGCGLCANACERDVLVYSEQMDSHGFHRIMLGYPSRCVACGGCALMCPDAVISITTRKLAGEEASDGDEAVTQKMS